MLLAGLALLVLIILAFRPRPVEVDLARVSRGPLQVAVREDGRARIKDRYVVSAPLSGQLQRIQLKPGDFVRAGRTILAEIKPLVPELLDPRQRLQSEARSQAAEAALAQAAAILEREKSALEFAQSELSRAITLQEAGTLPVHELEAARYQEQVTRENVRAARFAVEIAAHEHQLAQAALARFQDDSGYEDSLFSVHPPVSGQILRVFQESAQVVTPGTPLLELGDASNLEIEADVLSSDAVQIQPGARVTIEYWGGAQPLEAQVRLIEPSAFTKISALGVEEQRVWVIADLISPRENWQALGDAYRVEVRIVTWETEETLKAPSGALFRHHDQWAVFLARNGRAELRPVEAGRRGELEVQILSGLAEGDVVVVHPGDRLRPGARIRAR
jgi:HlyD family secretion protein